jgi:hypothetical protein
MIIHHPRYQQDLVSDDPIRAEVARRQLAALMRMTPNSSSSSQIKHSPDEEYLPSRWVHVPVDELLAEAGNTTTTRANGTLESGHEPFHHSRSGRCLVIWPASGRWYCRSCRATGDTAALVMTMYGWRYPQAAAWLECRYGPPAASTHNTYPRPPRRTQRALHIREST